MELWQKRLRRHCIKVRGFPWMFLFQSLSQRFGSGGQLHHSEKASRKSIRGEAIDDFVELVKSCDEFAPGLEIEARLQKYISISKRV